ncbi:MAG: aquaporin, partial [Acidobacteriota bacterium]
ASGLAQLLIGLLVWGIGAGLGGTTGFAINPARDLGPRIAHAILPIPGKGDSNFGYGLAVPVAGGLVGGVLAGLFMKVVGL